MNEIFPDITVVKPEVNAFGGLTVEIQASQLLLEGETVMTWSDKNTPQCEVAVKLDGQAVNSGDVLSKAGTLTVTVTNGQGKSSSADILLTIDAVSGAVQIGDMQVGQETDLLAGITLANGAELVKVAIEMDGQATEIADPQHFTPDYPGTCSLIFTVKGKNGDVAEMKADNLTIKPMDYTALEITNIKPVDILPIIGQIEFGDKQAYDHIEHLRIAEATRIREMMWTYGAGNHSAEEYQQLMMRLHTGMTLENPK